MGPQGGPGHRLVFPGKTHVHRRLSTCDRAHVFRIPGNATRTLQRREKVARCAILAAPPSTSGSATQSPCVLRSTGAPAELLAPCRRASFVSVEVSLMNTSGCGSYA